MLENVPVLNFDHYEKYIEWPQDTNQWTSNEADLRQIRIPRLKEDLSSLLKGIQVVDPLNGKIISPSKYILIEEPSGRERDEIKAYIDLVVYVDVPQDICVTRLIERVVDMEVWNSQGTFEGETKESLVKQLTAVTSWIQHYRKARSMYMTGSDLARRHADIVVNGLLPIEEITSIILSEVKGKENENKKFG